MYFLLLIKRNWILSFFLSLFLSLSLFLAIGDISSPLGGFSEFLCCGNSAVLPGDCGCVEQKWQPFARDSKGIPETRVWNSRKVILCALVEYLVITWNFTADCCHNNYPCRKCAQVFTCRRRSLSKRRRFWLALRKRLVRIFAVAPSILTTFSWIFSVSLDILLSISLTLNIPRGVLWGPQRVIFCDPAVTISNNLLLIFVCVPHQLKINIM